MAPEKSSSEINVRRIGGRIGAIIEGVDISQPLEPVVVDALRNALWENKAIFFRGQNVTDESQINFTRYFGELGEVAHPNGAGPENPQVSSIIYEKEYRTDHWHTDATSSEYSPGIGVLWPIELPQYGGATLWANTASAYLDLPEPLQRFAEALWGVHSNRNVFADPRRLTELPPLDDEGSESSFTWQQRPFETIHPLVRVHPETGERNLLVGAHLRHILGYNEFQSSDLRQLFQSYIERPENTVRWQWELGDVAVFDNRFTQHYAVADYNTARTLHRVSTLGGRNVSVDGRHSEVRIGDSSHFAPAGASN